MFTIDQRQIGGGHPVFIIAELSANHNGSLQTAIDTIRAAKKAGADAIKLQTYTADSITLNCDQPDFIIKGTIWEGRKLHDLYAEAYTPWEWHARLFEVAKEEGLICFSSPFDVKAVDFLEELNVPAYKIASFEITDIPLIRYTASKQKPLILSTGIATKEDIELAIATCREVGNNQLALLKCTSSYPAPIDEANLTMIPQFEKDFDVIPGLSDHTMGSIVPIVATSLGAKIIEKHFILDRSMGGPDASFSMNPTEFKEMVDAVRAAESALGNHDYQLTKKQQDGRQFARSLYVSADIKAGDIVTEKHIRSVRPGYGAHPKYLDQLIGKRANRDLTIGDRVELTYFDEV
jgi:pseudaminic acid synthase